MTAPRKQPPKALPPLVRYAQIPDEEKRLCDDLIWNRGDDPVGAFTAHFRGKKVEVAAQTEADEILIQQAKNSDPSAFKTVYDEKALDLLIDQRERAEDLFNILVGNDAARGFLFDKLREAFLRRVLAQDSQPATV